MKATWTTILSRLFQWRTLVVLLAECLRHLKKLSCRVCLSFGYLFLIDFVLIEVEMDHSNIPSLPQKTEMQGIQLDYGQEEDEGSQE